MNAVTFSVEALVTLSLSGGLAAFGWLWAVQRAHAATHVALADRVAALEKGEAVTRVQMQHIVEKVDEIHAALLGGRRAAE